MAAFLTRPPVARPIDDDGATLTRSTIGLTPAHVEFIKLLAQVAVSQYLDETDAPHVMEGDK